MSDLPRVLFAATSADKVGSLDTGCWLEELAAPYYVLKSRGFEPVFSSTKGGKIPIDPKSIQEQYLASTSRDFLKDDEAMTKLNNTVRMNEVDPKDFVALFVPGGHGVMIDGPKDMKPLVEAFAKQDKIVAAVCHGPAALTEAELNGKPLVKGKKVTSLSNSEEELIGADKDVPFLLEDRLKERGAIFEQAGNLEPHVVVDGKLITGQNPASSEPLGKAMADALSVAIR
ncbi:g6897 [Coccomyxa viridis]|uniref:G6897 protein n=1 Tax=Coccomyxa viridis TaxID=1274662 RepID=A0ABP1FWH1_9CHLO